MRALDAKRDSWKLITSGVLAHDTHGEVVVEEATKAEQTPFRTRSEAEHEAASTGEPLRDA